MKSKWFKFIDYRWKYVIVTPQTPDTLKSTRGRRGGNDCYYAAATEDTVYLIGSVLLNILHNQAIDVSAIHNPAIIGPRIVTPSA